MRHFPYLEYFMIYRPGLHNLQPGKKATEKVTKNWNWPIAK